MGPCFLGERGIVAVAGKDAEAFLNRLFTNSMVGLQPGIARYAALLSPQGKLLFDFFVFRRPAAFWIDCNRDQAADLARKLTMFRLRAEVAIEDKSPELGVAVAWGGALMEAPGPAFRDPRHNGLGYRIVAPRADLERLADNAALSEYEALRIALGVPKGGVDFDYGDAFVHDANVDLLHGVDFDKGCYVGQEVVSRVHHRNSARKRVVKVQFYGDPPANGSALTAGAMQIGRLTSQAGQEGLATARIDRLEEAAVANAPVLAADTLVGVTLPAASIVEAPAYAEDAI